jgi:ADP-glucose pyrophosphorylase
MAVFAKQTVAIILGGGAGSRLYPLTASRSKPAVPIAGKYRLVDIPISNCINSNLNRIFVLTQYNSASLNQHIKNTYHFDVFSHGFVDILAAEQTPNSDQWFQGTARTSSSSQNIYITFQTIIGRVVYISYIREHMPCFNIHHNSGFVSNLITHQSIMVRLKDGHYFFL